MVYRTLAEVPDLSQTIVTMGTFDGVHLGHRTVLDRFCTLAINHRAPSVLVTFDPHPRAVLQPNEPPQYLLTTTDEKIRLLRAFPIDHIVIAPFTHEFSLLSAQAYIADFLVRYFRPAWVVTGYNHQFGHGRQGNIDLLRRLGPSFGYSVEEIPQHLVDEAEVSSTRIRQALQLGDVRQAHALLGYHYFVHGTVVHGDQLGRSLGFPTANLQPAHPNKLIPADGIYAVRAQIQGSNELLSGVTAIGKRPTVQGTKRTIETYLFDFDKAIYGAGLTLYFHEFIRAEEHFPTIADLTAKMHEDVRHAKDLLASMPQTAQFL